MKLKHLIIPLLIFLLIPGIQVSAETISITDSGHATYSETTEENDSSTNCPDTESQYDGKLNSIYMDFDNYAVTQKTTQYLKTGYTNINGDYVAKTYIYVTDSKTGNSTQINSNSASYCLPVTINTSSISAPNINASVCIYGIEEGHDIYKMIIDFDTNDFDVTQHTGSGWFTMSYDGDKYFEWIEQDKDGYCYHKLGSAIHTATQFNYGGGASIQSAEWTYSTGSVSDYWEYKYYYNSNTSTEYCWFNVTKTQSPSRWHSFHWMSKIEGETTQWQYNEEDSFDTSGFNWTTHGYLINATINFTSSTSEVINVKVPGVKEEEEEAPTGKQSVSLYFLDAETEEMLTNVQLNAWGEGFENFSGTVDRIKSFEVNESTTFFFNCSHSSYTWKGEMYGYTGYIDVLNYPVVRKAYFYPSSSEDVNKSYLNFYVNDYKTSEPIEGVMVTVQSEEGFNYNERTNQNGFANFDLKENTTYDWTVVKEGYYRQTGTFTLGTEGTIKKIDLNRKESSQGIDDDGDGLVDEDPIDGIDNDGDGLIDEDPGGQAEPTPTEDGDAEEVTTTDYATNPAAKQNMINRFINTGWNLGYTLFTFALLMSIIAVLKKGGQL